MKAAEFQRLYGRGAPDQPAKPKIRMPKPRKMSRAEQEYERILKSAFSDYHEIRYEQISFVLPHGTRYMPDFTVWHERQLLLVVEVKGSYRLHSAGASFEKFKSAVSAFPHFKFRLAQKTGDGWATQDYNL